MTAKNLFRKIDVTCYALGIALIVTYLIQTLFLIHPDVLYLVHASNLMYEGGSYSHDFFETNPPLIMYLYMPAVWINKISHINIILILRVYLLAWCFVSLSLCTYLLNKLHIARWLYYILLWSMMVGLLFLPAHELGQRDHLFMLATFPYLFAIMLRLENKPITPFLACFIGFLAGVGIELKPFFLCLPFLIEGYYAYKKRTLLALFRIETIMIAVVFLFYVCYAMYFHPDYFQIILPLVSRLYFIGTASPWLDFFSKLDIVFCIAAVIFFLCARTLKTNDQSSTISTVFFIALCGYCLAFIIPHAGFYYHVIPALGCAYILFSYLLSQVLFHSYLSLRTLFNIKNTILFIFSLFLFIFVIESPIATLVYTIYKIHKSHTHSTIKQLFDFFSTQKNPSYTYFSDSTAAIIFHYYSPATYLGTYPLFWWERGLFLVTPTKQIKNDEKYLIDLVITNLKSKQPHFILIDKIKPKIDEKNDIDYVNHFNKFSSFTNVFSNYHYKMTIGRFEIYEYNI